MAMESIQQGRLTWTNITNPKPEDIDALRKKYKNFHPLDLEDTLSRIERPKIDEYDDYLFVVMQFPRWDYTRRISTPTEVDFFVGAGYVITIHDEMLPPLVNMFEQCKTDAEARKKYLTGAGMLLHAVIDRLVDYIFPILYKVDANIRSIEENLFAEDTRQTIEDLSIIRRDVIALKRIVKPQLAILYRLEQIDRPFFREDLDVYFGDILDHMQKARDIVDDHAEVIEGLTDTTDALASHNINEVMRILTVISVIMLPLTLISGILGMNIPIPYQTRPVSFWGTMSVMLLVSIGMLAYFRYRRWL